MPLRTLLLMLLTSLALLACGGGSSPENPPPVPPPVTVTTEYYHLRVDLESTSDWTTLSLPAAVQAVRTGATSGAIERHGATAERLWLVAADGAADPIPRQTLTVDIALSPAQLGSAMNMLLEKGVKGAVTVRLSARDATGAYAVLQETLHTGVVAGHSDTNPLALSLSSSGLPRLTAEAPPVKREVLAFYYPWYVPSDWDLSYFIDGPLQRYSTDENNDIERIVDQAMAAGVSGFISSWWGQANVSNDRFQRLLDVIGERDFKTSLYFETLREGVPLADTAMIAELSYALREYGQHPAFLRWDDRPVIFIWASGRIPAERWRTILARVREAAGPAYFVGMGCDTIDLDVFDGVHDYTVNQPADLARHQRMCGAKTRNHFLLSPGGQRKLWAATVMPGYDDRALADRAEHLLVARDAGNYYRATWQAALASNPDLLLITSWNEWAENTQIESSLLYGDLYERLTREYAQPWRSAGRTESSGDQ